MRLTSTIVVAAVGFALSGCTTERSDHHVLKLHKTYESVVSNPHEWALQQFADGPISGADVSDYARLVLSRGLKEALADLDGDKAQELLLRQDCPARVWEVLVFSPVKRGYRYMGHFPASTIVLNTDQASVLVYESCGGHKGCIRSYRHDGVRFVCHSTEELSVGDGAPDENNQRLTRLFAKDQVINWAKTPNKILHGIVANAPNREN